MRMAVTGGAGFVGSHVVERFVERGHDVLVVDNLSRGLLSQVPAGVSLSQTDITGAQSLKDIVAFKPDVVVHLAAQMSVVDSLQKPKHDAIVNVLGTVNMLDAAHKAQARAFVFASSGGALYGNAKQVPCSEATPILPESPYGISKANAERYLEYYDRRPDSDLRCVSLRLSNVFGPRQSNAGEGGVISIFADRMANDSKTPVIFGDGTQTRDFVFVKDVVSAIERAIDSQASGAFNIGTGKETSLLLLVKTLRDVTGYEGLVDVQPARTGEVLRSCLATEHANEVLGWRPQVSFFEGLKEVVESVRRTPARKSA